MSFPPTWQDFVAQYQFRDNEEVYTNGSKLIPVFRIEQMMEHYHEHIKEENERLVIKLNAEHIARQNAEIDNAKLHELLQRTWNAFHNATAKEFNDTKSELREFGIEVD